MAERVAVTCIDGRKRLDEETRRCGSRGDRLGVTHTPEYERFPHATALAHLTEHIIMVLLGEGEGAL